ncbi:hypothetical protein [Pseudoalteromonas phage PH357]|nr:hypothetical protein [Pseudoalteromonas phage PH357]
MELNDIDIFRVNKVLEKGVSDATLAKRMWKAKKDNNWHEYLALSMVKAKMNFDKGNS